MSYLFSLTDRLLSIDI